MAIEKRQNRLGRQVTAGLQREHSYCRPPEVNAHPAHQADQDQRGPELALAKRPHLRAAPFEALSRPPGIALRWHSIAPPFGTGENRSADKRYRHRRTTYNRRVHRDLPTTLSSCRYQRIRRSNRNSSAISMDHHEKDRDRTPRRVLRPMAKKRAGPAVGIVPEPVWIRSSPRLIPPRRPLQLRDHVPNRPEARTARPPVGWFQTGWNSVVRPSPSMPILVGGPAEALDYPVRMRVAVAAAAAHHRALRAERSRWPSDRWVQDHWLQSHWNRPVHAHSRGSFERYRWRVVLSSGHLPVPLTERFEPDPATLALRPALPPNH